jgi:RND family efflux transporter MFP subunit
MEAALETQSLKIAASEARLKELVDQAERLEKAGLQAFSVRDVEQAKLRVETYMAEIAVQEGVSIELTAEREAQQSALKSATHLIRLAEAQLREAQLDLNRKEIRSPTDGVIQKLFVAPGQKRLLGMDDPESATIAIIFQPENLQARIDVPLEEASQLSIGQPVILTCNLLPSRKFKGRVTRIAGMADIQRNTLQAKVAFLEPDPLLRPEMLCRAEFLSFQKSEQNGAKDFSANQSTKIDLFVPENALTELTGNVATVWTLDEDKVSSVKRAVLLGAQRKDGYVQVIKGLNSGDPVIINPPSDLKQGDRIKITNLN